MSAESGPPAATILHADLDAFYASVEQRDDPRLAGRPVIVGGGVVLAASYEAKAAGVRTAMGGSAARRLCPAAVVVPPRFEAYSAAGEAVFEVFRATTPLVEPISVDEAFLDVGGLRRLAGDPVRVAADLRRRVLAEVGLPISVGIARTKFMAKVASGLAKPDGLLLVPPDGELAFLHGLALERLWGVGPVTAATLRGLGISTVGQVADLEEATLVSVLGRAVGRHLHALAHNRDPRPVQAGHRRRSIGSQRAFGPAPRTHPDRVPSDIAAEVIALTDRVTARMRAGGRVGRTVSLRLRFADYTRATRSHTLPVATADTATVLTAARALLDALMPTIATRGLTLIGVTVSEVTDGEAEQLVLPLRACGASVAGPTTTGPTTTGPTTAAAGTSGTDALDAAVDGVRERFGPAAITRGVLLGRGPSVPLLPD